MNVNENTRKSRPLRTAMTLGVLAVSGLALAGCMSSPTYGTGKTANEQLFDDLTGVLSLGPKDKPNIEYKPRPELVKPGTTAVLPTPQQSATVAAAWPEGPEQKRLRLRAEATANQDNPAYRSPIVNDLYKPARELTPDEMRAEVARRKAIANATDPTARRYLSEPPLDYRVAASTAPQGEMGEDEWKKERDAKSAARANRPRERWSPF